MKKQAGAAALDLSKVDVVAPNFKRRLSGVTSTILQLVPLQSKMLGIATLGPGLPADLPRIRWWQVPLLLRRPAKRRFRIWHARRNVEMLGGLVLRDLLRAPLKLVFTSAAQRHHRRWTKFLIGRMDAVIATSRRSAAYLDVPNTVVMHGIDLERFFPPASKQEALQAVGLDPDLRLVGCFGRVRRQKGTDLFVDAMIALLPDRPDWSAVITGRTTAEHRGFEDELRRRVSEAGLSDRILFLGELDDIRPWFRALSLFIAPQRWEGFGLTPLEAMASGVPVVATDVGAFPELVPPEAGTVVAAGDLPALIEAARAFMGDDERRRLAGDAALAHVRTRFPLMNEARQIVGVYQRLWDQAG